MSLPSFQNQALLTTALTHRSALNEPDTLSNESNERLEFLGDAVLELATTQFLFTEFPDKPEGVLTAYRSALVKTSSLAQVAHRLDLGSRIYMSKGEEASGGRSNESLLADTTEAIIGALYLDQGYQAADAFLREHLFGTVREILEKGLYRDAKSHFQEVVQAKGLPTPTYEVTDASGPDHDKVFTVQVLVGSRIAGTGTGKSKQLAQQAAAKDALESYS